MATLAEATKAWMNLLKSDRKKPKKLKDLNDEIEVFRARFTKNVHKGEEFPEVKMREIHKEPVVVMNDSGSIGVVMLSFVRSWPEDLVPAWFDVGIVEGFKPLE